MSVRPRSFHADGQPKRHYDWNTDHFFPDVHDFGSVQRRRASYGYVDDEWVRDLYHYNRLQAEQRAVQEAAATALPDRPAVATDDRREVMRQSDARITSPARRAALRSRSAGREEFLRGLSTHRRPLQPPPRVPSPDPAGGGGGGEGTALPVYVSQLHSYRGADREGDVGRQRVASEGSEEAVERRTAATRQSRLTRHQQEVMTRHQQYDFVNEENGRDDVTEEDFYVSDADRRKPQQRRREFSSSFENIYDLVNKSEGEQQTNGDRRDDRTGERTGDGPREDTKLPSGNLPRPVTEDGVKSKAPQSTRQHAEFYISAENYSGRYRQPPAKPRRQPKMADGETLSTSASAPSERGGPVTVKAAEGTTAFANETYGKFYVACGYKMEKGPEGNADRKEAGPGVQKRVEDDAGKTGAGPVPQKRVEDDPGSTEAGLGSQKGAVEWGVRDLIDEERQSYMAYKQAYELGRSSRLDHRGNAAAPPGSRGRKDGPTKHPRRIVRAQSSEPLRRRPADEFDWRKGLLPTTEDYEYVLRKVYPATPSSLPREGGSERGTRARRVDAGPPLVPPPRPEVYRQRPQQIRSEVSLSAPRIVTGSFDDVRYRPGVYDAELERAGVYLSPHSLGDLSLRQRQLTQQAYDIQNEKQYAKLERPKNVNALDAVLDELPAAKSARSDSELDRSVRIGVDLVDRNTQQRRPARGRYEDTARGAPRAGRYEDTARGAPRPGREARPGVQRSTERGERRVRRSAQRPADRSTDRVVERMAELPRRVVSRRKRRPPFTTTLQKAVSEKEIRLETSGVRREAGEWHGFERRMEGLGDSQEWLQHQPSGSRAGLVGDGTWDGGQTAEEGERRRRQEQQEERAGEARREQEATQRRLDEEQNRRQRDARTRQQEQDAQRHLVENYGPLSNKRRARQSAENRRREPDRSVAHARRNGARPHPYEAPEGRRGAPYEGPPSPRRNEELPSPRRNVGPPSPRTYEELPSPRRNEGPPSPRRNEEPPSPRRYEELPSSRQYEGPPSSRRQEEPPSSHRNEGLPSSRRYEYEGQPFSSDDEAPGKTQRRGRPTPQSGYDVIGYSSGDQRQSQFSDREQPRFNDDRKPQYTDDKEARYYAEKSRVDSEMSRQMTDERQSRMIRQEESRLNDRNRTRTSDYSIDRHVPEVSRGGAPADLVIPAYRPPQDQRKTAAAEAVSPPAVTPVSYAEQSSSPPPTAPQTDVYRSNQGRTPHHSNRRRNVQISQRIGPRTIWTCCFLRRKYHTITMI